MTRRWQALRGIGAVLLLTDAMPAGADERADLDRGRQLAAVCTGCHAPDAAPAAALESFPDPWRLNEQALRQRLLDYRQDLGAPTLMNRIAKGYTTEELTLIAAAIAAGTAEIAP